MTEDQPLISYLIPLHNHEAFVVRALDSILEDKYDHREILIVDDGSTDRSADRVEEWILKNKEQNCTFIKRDNRGLPATLNELISASKGQFLRMLASDDTLLPGSSRFLLSGFANRPEVACIFSDCKVINDSDQVVAESALSLRGASVGKYEADLKRCLITNWAVSGSCMLIQKHVFLRVFNKYNESILIEDWYMYLTLSANNSLVFLPGQVACYRLHASNKSRTRNLEERISGLQSLRDGLETCIPLYEGKYLLLLRAQIYLLAAKIAYLERDIFLLVSQTARFFLFSIKSKVFC